VQWFIPVIPGTWEAQVGGSCLVPSLRKEHESLSEKTKTKTKQKELGT
jgi:hypothetical protein